MRRYLQEAPFAEAMDHWHEDHEPLKHTVWTGDFMSLCGHDIACPVCFDAAAIIARDVTPGQYKQVIQPCDTCAKEGYAVVKLIGFWRWIFRRQLWWSR